MTNLKPFNLAIETLSTEGEENENADNLYRKLYNEKQKEINKKEKEAKLAEEAAKLAEKKSRNAVSSLGRNGKYTYDYNGKILKVKNPVKRNTLLEATAKFVDSAEPETKIRRNRKETDSSPVLNRQETKQKYAEIASLWSLKETDSSPVHNRLETKQKSMVSVNNQVGHRVSIGGTTEDPLVRVLKHYEKKDKKLMETMLDPNTYLAQPEAFVPVAGVKYKCEIAINEKDKKQYEKMKPKIKFITQKNEEGVLENKVNFQEYRDTVLQHESHRHKIIEELAQKHNSYKGYLDALGMDRMLKDLDGEGGNESAVPFKRLGKRIASLKDSGADTREARNASRRLSSKQAIDDLKSDSPPKTQRDTFQKVEIKDSKNMSHAVNYNTNLDLLAGLIGEKDSQTLLLKSSRLPSMELSRRDDIETLQKTKFSVITRSKDPNDTWRNTGLIMSARTMNGWNKGGSGQGKTLRQASSQQSSPSGSRLKNPKKPTDADFSQSIGRKPLSRHRSLPKFDPSATMRSFWKVW